MFERKKFYNLEAWFVSDDGSQHNYFGGYLKLDLDIPVTITVNVLEISDYQKYRANEKEIGYKVTLWLTGRRMYK